MPLNQLDMVDDLGAAWRRALDECVDAVYPRLVTVREQLHAHPEPSGEERETTRHLLAQLDESRFSTRTGPEERGLIVEPANAPDGQRILLRADIDALRLDDRKEVAYRSTRPGLMHGCGHDGHAATVLGAILALDAAAANGALPRAVPWRAVFQPAEETNRGALEMIDAGTLEGVAAAIGAHMDPTRMAGSVGVRTGVFTADCVEIRMRVIGKGGHAARPHESLDPIATAAQLISSIYLFVPRTSDSNDPIVVSFGQIHGGTTANVIPDTVTLAGTLRTYREATRKRTMDHIRKLARSLAEASDTRIDIEFIEGPPALVNDAELADVLRGEATRLLGAAHVDEIDRPSMGGEDFANYLAHVPGAMFRLGCGFPDVPNPPLHSPLFDLNPEALRVGAKILARGAVVWALREAT